MRTARDAVYPAAIEADVSEERLKTADGLGADHLVHAGEQDVAGEILAALP